MKKLLSVFALMAAMLMGAVTLTSCDEEDTVVQFYHYKLTAHYDTQNPEVANNEEFQAQNAAVEKSISKIFGSEFSSRPSEAEKTWSQWDKQLDKQYQELRDEVARYFKDPTLTLTISLLQDSKVWRSKTWSSNTHP